MKITKIERFPEGKVVVVRQKHFGDPFMALCVSPKVSLDNGDIGVSIMLDLFVSLYNHRFFTENPGGEMLELYLANKEQTKLFYEVISRKYILRTYQPDLTDEDIERLFAEAEQ